MNKNKRRDSRKISFVVGWFFCCTVLQAQNKEVKLHSHNDYAQNVPFWNAYAQEVNSIEIDLVLVDKALFVAHDLEDVSVERTLERLYMKPLQEAVEMRFGNPQGLQFLIDLKGDAMQSMVLLLPILEKYEDLITKNKITFVISGNKPVLSYFLNLPAYVQIDLQVQDILTTEVGMQEKIGLISYNFQSISTWNGNEKMDEKEQEEIRRLIAKAHQMDKPIRFWATPDTEEAWKMLYELKVDFINTDQPAALRILIQSYFL
ncbi:hypothetical protein [Myroides odoratus]|uniref:hypothetical protein n=1 Tax=Myroides odoratus TaxID=256 RepID=UPI0039AEC2C3